VNKIIPHPQYNGASNDNDYALLQLAKPATATANINYACLPPGSKFKPATVGRFPNSSYTKLIHGKLKPLESNQNLKPN